MQYASRPGRLLPEEHHCMVVGSSHEDLWAWSYQNCGFVPDPSWSDRELAAPWHGAAYKDSPQTRGVREDELGSITINITPRPWVAGRLRGGVFCVSAVAAVLAGGWSTRRSGPCLLRRERPCFAVLRVRPSAAMPTGAGSAATLRGAMARALRTLQVQDRALALHPLR